LAPQCEIDKLCRSARNSLPYKCIPFCIRLCLFGAARTDGTASSQSMTASVEFRIEEMEWHKLTRRHTDQHRVWYRPHWVRIVHHAEYEWVAASSRWPWTGWLVQIMSPLVHQHWHHRNFTPTLSNR